MENKSDKFKRLAENRTNKILHYMSLLGNLSNTKIYEYNDKEINKIFNALEKQLTINNLKKRSDILIFNTDGKPEIIVECKAPSIKITQNTFDQIARYNLKLRANYLILTNGLEHFYCKMDFKNETYIFLKDIPHYK